MIRTRWIFTSLLLPALISPAWSQRRRDPLTRLEVDQLRDTAWEPELRLKLYIKFARARLAAVEQVRSDPKVTDRAQATHDKLQDFLDECESCGRWAHFVVPLHIFSPPRSNANVTTA